MTRTSKHTQQDVVWRARYRIRRLIGWRFSSNIKRAAEEMGIAYWPLYRVVNGEGVPTLKLLEEIAGFFDLTYDQLMAPDDEGVVEMVKT